jgi:hypothetical protein
VPWPPSPSGPDPLYLPIPFNIAIAMHVFPEIDVDPRFPPSKSLKLLVHGTVSELDFFNRMMESSSGGLSAPTAGWLVINELNSLN